jgi:hypothetical protein
MSFLASPKVPAAQPLPAPPAITDPEVEAARKREQEANRRRKGFGAQLLTGGQGVTTAANVNQARLFGGTATYGGGA